MKYSSGRQIITDAVLANINRNKIKRNSNLQNLLLLELTHTRYKNAKNANKLGCPIKPPNLLNCNRTPNLDNDSVNANSGKKIASKTDP